MGRNWSPMQGPNGQPAQPDKFNGNGLCRFLFPQERGILHSVFGTRNFARGKNWDFPYFFWGNHVAPLLLPGSPFAYILPFLQEIEIPPSRKIFSQERCVVPNNEIVGYMKNQKTFLSIVKSLPTYRWAHDSWLNQIWMQGRDVNRLKFGQAPSPHSMANVQY